MQVDPYIRQAKLKRVIDGDTFDVEIDMGWGLRWTERVRLAGYNAPEPRGASRQLGIEATRVAKQWFEKHPRFWIRSLGYTRGKYGRTIAEVFSEESKLAQHLIEHDQSEE